MRFSFKTEKIQKSLFLTFFFELCPSNFFNDIQKIEVELPII